MKRFNNKPVHKLTLRRIPETFRSSMEWGCKSFTVNNALSNRQRIKKGNKSIADGIMFGLNSPSGQKLKLSGHSFAYPHSVPSDVNSLILQNILSAFTMSQKKWRYRELPRLLSRYHMLLSSDDLSLLLTVKTEKGHIVSLQFY